MDEATGRQAILSEIATLEPSYRRAGSDLRTKEGPFAGYPATQRTGPEYEIRGLKSFIAAEARLRARAKQ